MALAWALVLALTAAAVVLPVGPAAATVLSARVSRPAFSPGSDGLCDTVDLIWTVTGDAAQVLVEVRRADQNVGQPALRTIDLGPLAAGFHRTTWDGRNDAAEIVPDGQYLLRVVERDAGGLLVSESVAAVSLDTQAPRDPRFEDGLDGTDTTRPTFELLGFAPEADTLVLLRNGAPFDTLLVSDADSAFARAVTLEIGTTTFALQSWDRACNRSNLTTAIAVTYRKTPEVTALRAQPTEFSPNGDGIVETTSALFTLTADTPRLEVQVRESNLVGSIVVADSLPYVRLLDGPATAGDYAFVWTGTDSLGGQAPEATYFFFVRAESLGVANEPRPGSPRATRTVLDRTAPGAPVLRAPPPARTTQPSVTLTGTATAADSVLVSRNGQVLARSRAPEFTLVPGLVLGDNPLVLVALDRAGNRSAPAGPFVVRYEEPLGFYAPERFRANDVFELNLSTAARSVRLDLYSLDGRLVRTLSSNSSNLRYELSWNLQGDDGSTVGDGPYVAHVTVTYPDGSTETRRGAVVVVK